MLWPSQFELCAFTQSQSIVRSIPRHDGDNYFLAVDAIKMSAYVEFDALFDVPRIQQSSQRVLARRPGERLRTQELQSKTYHAIVPAFGHWSTCRGVIAHTEGCW